MTDSRLAPNQPVYYLHRNNAETNDKYQVKQKFRQQLLQQLLPG